jgi:mRNA interferase YafQ
MLALEVSTQFKKDFRKCQKQKIEDILLVGDVIGQLQRQQTLQAVYRDHALTGNWDGFRDCHIKPDLVLIYRVIETRLQLARLGSHSELF